MRRILFSVILFISCPALVAAQSEVEFLLEDMLFITDRYVEPAADASVALSSNGWFHTAEVDEPWSLDISLNANYTLFPSAAQSFSVADSDFNLVEVRGASSATIPSTLGGDTDEFFDFTLNGDAYEFQAFEGIDQIGIGYPYLQANLSLPFKTEVVARYAPPITIGKSDYSIYGLGLKHSLSQYFSPEESPFHLAAMVSYSFFDLDLFFDAFELRAADDQPPLATFTGSKVDAHSFRSDIIASYRWDEFTLTGSFGMNYSWVDYLLLGEEGFLLTALNEVLVNLSEEQMSVSGTLTGSYQFSEKWRLTGQLAIGNFYSFNLGGAYTLL